MEGVGGVRPPPPLHPGLRQSGSPHDAPELQCPVLYDDDREVVAVLHLENRRPSGATSSRENRPTKPRLADADDSRLFVRSGGTSKKPGDLPC
jgi:hypothetical protein